MNNKFRVLFLCRANSARSIMAEALLRQLGSDKFEAFSAGAEPADDVHPLTLDQLRPTIADLGKLRAKSWIMYASLDAPRMDLVIAMSDEVGEAHAPAFPGKPVFCQWTFADPLAATGSDKEQKRLFEQVFRQILRRLSIFVALPIHTMAATERREAINAMAE
jgi:arsenate reductase